jgi:hypothetical protein
MATFWTILAGTLVFVIGQAIQRFILEPIQEQRRVIGDIANALLYLGNVGPLPWVADMHTVLLPEQPNDASRMIRLLAARLRATLWTIPFYDSLARLRFVPHRGTITGAAQSLIGWSNSLHSGQPDVLRTKVGELLGLPHD